MRKAAKDFARFMMQHRYGITLLAYLTAATITGLSCVAFMKGFEFVLERRLDFTSIGLWCWLTTPFLFLFSVELIRRVAPCAAGTGIPQAIFAAKHMTPSTETSLSGLVSSRTLIIKIAALFLGLWAGASTGREGPTVHVAVCIFIAVLMVFRRISKLNFDLRSAVVAGGAAGLAAAFNTPLAGVTFAIEELSADYFGSMKDYVLIAIIIAAIAAKSVTGEYTYFGRLREPDGIPLAAPILIGLAGGVLGAFFSTILTRGTRYFTSLKEGVLRYLIPVLLSMALLALAAFAGTAVLGPGNLAAQDLTRGEFGPWAYAFPASKMLATLLTYWSGIAGGIFAPCLSIGAALGASVAQWLNFSTAACAMVGMAAFLSGTIQAPITAFVIIFEMTGQHQMLLPVMLASLLAYIVAHLFGAKHLYQSLAESYQYLLDPKRTS